LYFEFAVTYKAPNRASIVIYWTIATTAGLFLFRLCYQYFFYSWLVSVVKAPPPLTNPPTVLLIELVESVPQGLLIGDLVMSIVWLERSRSKIFVYSGLAGPPNPCRAIARLRGDTGFDRRMRAMD
jgi:hypothetical protein